MEENYCYWYVETTMEFLLTEGPDALEEIYELKEKFENSPEYDVNEVLLNMKSKAGKLEMRQTIKEMFDGDYSEVLDEVFNGDKNLGIVTIERIIIEALSAEDEEEEDDDYTEEYYTEDDDDT